MKKKFASSIDVARLAGVSQSTVSRALRNDPVVSKDATEKVLEAARTLGYRPSLLPQIMLTQQSRLVAVIIGGAHNPYYSQVVAQLAARLQAMQCQMLLVQADDGDMLDGMVPQLSGYRVDAVISVLPILSPMVAERLASLMIPVISFNNTAHHDGICAVGGDNVDAGRQIARHLVAQGAQRPAFLGGPDRNPTSAARQSGFVDEMLRLGHSPRISAGDFTYEGGREQARIVFSGDDVPDAVFCANDLIAIGMIDALGEEPGLSTPARLLVAGYDDIPQAGWSPYRLTSFRQNTEGILDHVFGILRRLYDGSPWQITADALFRGELIQRQSTLAGIDFRTR